MNKLTICGRMTWWNRCRFKFAAKLAQRRLANKHANTDSPHQ